MSAEASFRLTGETGTQVSCAVKGLADQPVTSVDRLSGSTAGRLARDLAGLAPDGHLDVLPRSVRLVDVPTGSRSTRPVGPSASGLGPGTGCGWSWADGRGPGRVDLCAVGPHALVAGTTGSGKSELLQTLIASLALHHPPDRCSFLLVDYKGGAAFAEAAALPHTVGVVTDLDGQTTARALRSLTAELTRRESILAAPRSPMSRICPRTSTWHAW